MTFSGTLCSRDSGPGQNGLSGSNEQGTQHGFWEGGLDRRAPGGPLIYNSTSYTYTHNSLITRKEREEHAVTLNCVSLNSHCVVN